MQFSGRLSVIAVAALLACTPERAGAIALFNGTDLTGWTKRGGAATYHVENGEIVGSSPAPGSPNTFLTTDATFSDFVLELDFKISAPEFNSGVQFRSQSLPSHANGRVFGYQAEIDPSTRAWSGGLYFEGGSPQRSAGWLDDLSDNPAARAAFVLNDWNHFRIVAVDRRIKTWINDVPAADFTDNHPTGFLASGFVGLQVHSVSSGPAGQYQVRWRDVNLTELTPTTNNLVVSVDPLTGQASLKNPSPLPISIEGYSIGSPSGSLLPADGNWLSLADQGLPGWEEAPPDPALLIELNPSTALTLASGASYPLGRPFNPSGARDLAFEYFAEGAPDATPGVISYRLATDFDNDADVDGADLTAWRANFHANGGGDADGDADADGVDFLMWQRQLGATLPAASASAVAVPESSTALLAAVATVITCCQSRTSANAAKRCRNPAATP